MTEQELIEIAKNDFFELEHIDKSLITKNVVDNLEIYKCSIYHKILDGVNPNCFSKEKTLKLLKCDGEIYGLLSEDLQADTDILNLITKYPDKLPKALFENREGVKYLLNRYNVEGKSWATFGIDKVYCIIAPDITKQEYCVYPRGNNLTFLVGDIARMCPISRSNPCEESKEIAKVAFSQTMCFCNEFTQHID